VLVHNGARHKDCVVLVLLVSWPLKDVLVYQRSSHVLAPVEETGALVDGPVGATKVALVATEEAVSSMVYDLMKHMLGVPASQNVADMGSAEIEVKRRIREKHKVLLWVRC